MIPAIFFYIFAATAVVMALVVVSARNPIYSATALIGPMLASNRMLTKAIGDTTDDSSR